LDIDLAMRSFVVSSGVLALVVLCSGPVHQNPEPPRPKAPQQEGIRFQTDAEGIPLRDFVTWISRHLDGAVTFAPPTIEDLNAKKPRVIIEKAVSLHRSEIVGFAQDVLASHGLVLFNMGRQDRPLWLVESVARPTVLAGRTVYVAPERIEERRYDRTPVTTVVRLTRVRLDDVKKAILQGLGNRGVWGESLIPVPAVNGFILRESGRNVHGMAQLIRGLDVPSKTPAPANDPELAGRVEKLETRVLDLERRLAKLGR
jgi:hypothetical protein